MKKILTILPLLFVLITIPAYAESFDLRQGTASCNSPDKSNSLETATDECPPQASAFLEWCIEYQDGTECGESQRALATFTEIPFTFLDSNELRTLVHAEVSPKTDYSKMPEIYCIQEPAWTGRQTLTINGEVFELAKQFNTGDTFDSATQVHTGFPLQFTPQLVERLVLAEGLTMNTGDRFVWTTHWNAGYFVVEGQLEDSNGDGIGSCDEKDNIHNIAVGFDAVTVGLSSQMTFVWADPLELITDPNQPVLDIDNDGIPDSQDQCDFSPEVFNGLNDEDGCPDEVNTNDSPLADSDGDGIPDNADLCDLDAEIVNGFEDTDGCPDILEPVDRGNIEFTDLPEENVHVSISNDEPQVTNGITEYCNNAEVENCEVVLQQAIQNTKLSGTGIELPFEPNIFNLMIIFGGISAVIILVMRMKKK